MRRLLLLLVPVLLLLAGCGSARATGGGFVAGDAALTRVPVAERQAAPVVTGTGLDGEQLTTAQPGKVVVINVWGSWCAPCRAEAPDLQAAHEATTDQAVFIGIDTRDPDPAPARAFVRSFGIGYPSIHDPDGRTLLEFSGQLPPSGIPSTLVIDAEGRVAARVIGVVNKTTLVGLIEDTAAGK
ncbi:TlpA family protein disulfide reductase [Granulicoccus phenolivorans]|uniref:TlpA family protein disulfide reductase n=1 Tax=Granulicoccus phenolivorans TaxID=266854 RepID=UPI0003FEF486|nr:TlpA disulfide reductase family protein [Granulicoccus phenolivorans]